MEFVDLKAQYRRIRKRVDGRMSAVLEHGRFILGPEVEELEERLAGRIGAGYCITCSSGTDALLLALLALGVGRGDEVITTPFTFFATAEVIALAGARPVFVDIDPVTYNLEAGQLEAAISSRTRAILPVGLYGQPADMDAIQAIAVRHRLPVIEDAAQSFGALYKGRHSGSLSTIGCTSFFPSKPLGCYGDGGACFTSDEALAVALLELRNHGQEARYRHSRIGINGRLDTLQAAVLLAKLDVFDEELTARNEIANRYTALLKDAVHTPQVLPDRTSAWAQYTIEVDDREAVQSVLHGEEIPTAVHYPWPLHRQPAFAESASAGRAGGFPVAERAAERVLSLPMHPYLRPQVTERIVQAVKTAVRGPVGTSVSNLGR